jgi:branched-chain amino acid transport system ATP-binding protein
MLQLENLKCGYGSVDAVHDLSLEVASGQVVALVGPNGAGKTSTIMAIAGHVTVKSGCIRFDGSDISGVPAWRRIRLGIALVPEGRCLFGDLTVRENLVVGGYSLPIRHSAKNQETVFELFPILRERSEQLAGSLSGGEQQMLAIGRALMANPRLLLIDELSIGLMPKMIDACYEAIHGLRVRGVTILVVEQSTDRVLRLAEKVCVMESGSMVWQGSGSEARGNPKLIDAYLGIAASRSASP